MSKILNTLFGTLAVFFLCFLWIVYCLKDRTAAFALATVVALCSAYLLYSVQTESEARKNKKKTATQKVAALARTLRYGADNATLFESMMKYYGFEVQRADADSLVAVKSGVKSYVALRYASDASTREQLAKDVVAAKRASCAKLYLFAHKADKTLLDEANEQIPVRFADVANVYALLEQCDKLPRLDKSKPRRTKGFVAQYAFCRKRFGLYLTMTLFMTAISAVSYVKWYTLCWATVSLIAALYALLNKRYNAQPTAVTLD